MKRAVAKANIEDIFGYSDAELREILGKCLHGVDKRTQRYKTYKAVIADNSRKNSLSKYLNDIVSLIYLPDNIIFDIKTTAPENTLTDEQLKALDMLKDSLQERFIIDGLDVKMYEWLYSACLYGCYIVKCVVDGDSIQFKGINPADFHVFYEDIQSVDKEQIVVHTVRIPVHLARKKYPDAVFTEVSAPQKTAESNFLTLVSKQNEASGTLKVPTTSEFQPKQVGGYVEVHEMWMWSDRFDDYMMVQFVGDKVYKSKNPFFPKQNPFIRMCLDEVEGYFWGLSEIYYLLNLHFTLNRQLDKIDYLEEMLMRPPMLVYGISGSVETQELQNILKQPGAVGQIIDQTAQFDFYIPKLDVSVLYNSVKYVEDSIKEQSGISGVLAGKAMPNVRSASYAHILAQFASTALKKKALITEYIIETIMTLYATALIYTRQQYKSLINTPLRVDVFAHTSSPITAMSYQDMLLTLGETGLIPKEVLIDLLPLPKKERIKKHIEKIERIQHETTQE